jgi:hypothetical protein
MSVTRLSARRTANKNVNAASVPLDLRWIPFPKDIDFLVIAGGGGGGNGLYGAGGGGAGGYIEGTFPANIFNSNIQGSNIVVTVGAGGTAAYASPASTGNGSNSSIILAGSPIVNYLSVGGGGGQGYSPLGYRKGANGGSGGGGHNLADSPTAVGAGYGHPGPTQQGYPAGNGVNGGGTTGGGGGAGGAGDGPGIAGQRGGNGGPGRYSLITGSNVAYAGGGGGGTENFATVGLGGVGGGGNAAPISPNAASGTSGSVNTGGGGGGRSQFGSPGSALAGKGGSGVVILRAPADVTAATTGNVTISTSTRYKVFQFNQSGTIVFQ